MKKYPKNKTPLEVIEQAAPPNITGTIKPESLAQIESCYLIRAKLNSHSNKGIVQLYSINNFLPLEYN
ncbi:MAG: hypothetical protein V2I54_13250 [Bacteroidales bacterium]|nr:hypothetical protein [Bacteroidales bacterium]